MEQVIVIYFRHEHQFYACIATVIHQFDTVFIYLELLDQTIIELFNSADIAYIGDAGYKTIPAYEEMQARPLLIHLANLVISTQYAVNNHD